MLVQKITGSLSGTYSTSKSASEVAAFCNPNNQTIIAWIPRTILFDPSVIHYQKRLDSVPMANNIAAGMFNDQLFSHIEPDKVL